MIAISIFIVLFICLFITRIAMWIGGKIGIALNPALGEKWGKIFGFILTGGFILIYITCDYVIKQIQTGYFCLRNPRIQVFVTPEAYKKITYNDVNNLDLPAYNSESSIITFKGVEYVLYNRDYQNNAGEFFIAYKDTYLRDPMYMGTILLSRRLYMDKKYKIALYEATSAEKGGGLSYINLIKTCPFDHLLMEKEDEILGQFYKIKTLENNHEKYKK